MGLRPSFYVAESQESPGPAGSLLLQVEDCGSEKYLVLRYADDSDDGIGFDLDQVDDLIEALQAAKKYAERVDKDEE